MFAVDFQSFHFVQSLKQKIFHKALVFTLKKKKQARQQSLAAVLVVAAPSQLTGMG